ncbi:hypothetical protein [Pseudomonas poae]|uniref:Uncharacterized protein n=1 Tax=Pseudomonas poae TaxID=200451 RepID=A0A2S9E9X3_9PSED|nr:hypothetical protein [Pseudomonas poae]PRA33233.1 hypothetical protein CQZ97_04965 [Pseudomonas poae]PRC11680.1 hypothetical protein CQZ99_24490 [Pseudomonas poae]
MSFVLIYTIVLFASTFVILGLVLFAEYKKLDELESYFSENETVRRHKRFWGRNRPIDRFHRMGLMIDFLRLSKRHLKAGVVTEAELASVPLSLKRWALWPYRLGYIWVVMAFIKYFWIR